MAETGKSRDELEREGWRLSSTSSGAHLKRIIETYRELGFEVYLLEVSPQECAGCTVCFAGEEKITRVYTRPYAGDTMEEEGQRANPEAQG